jgi:hypothetical protein
MPTTNVCNNSTPPTQRPGSHNQCFFFVCFFLVANHHCLVSAHRCFTCAGPPGCLFTRRQHAGHKPGYLQGRPVGALATGPCTPCRTWRRAADLAFSDQNLYLALIRFMIFFWRVFCLSIIANLALQVCNDGTKATIVRRLVENCFIWKCERAKINLEPIDNGKASM